MKTLKKLAIRTLLVASTVTSISALANDHTDTVKTQNTATQSVSHEAFNVQVIGKGRPVILLPGLSSSSSVWDETVMALKSDYQLHVVQFAGFAGLPAAPSHKVGASLLEYKKRAIKNYITEQKLNDVVIVGHSLGGFLSLWIATEQTDNVRGVVNIDGLPALGALFAQAAQQTKDKPAQPRQFDPAAMVKGMANNTQWHAKMVEDMKRSDPMTSGRAMGELMRLDIREQLKAIAIPTLTLGAPAQGQPYVSYQQSQSNYEAQFENLPEEYKRMAYAKTSKHFIMADEPKWMNAQIKSFLQSI